VTGEFHECEARNYLHGEFGVVRGTSGERSPWGSSPQPRRLGLAYPAGTAAQSSGAVVMGAGLTIGVVSASSFFVPAFAATTS
jgi:hypothetical protein